MKKISVILLLLVVACGGNSSPQVQSDNDSYDDASLWCVVAYEKIGQTYDNPTRHPKTETSLNLEKEFGIAAEVYKKQNGITDYLVFDKHWNLTKNDFDKFGKQIGIEPFTQAVIDSPKTSRHITYYFHQFLTLENNTVALEICDIWYATTAYKQFSTFPSAGNN